MNLKSLLFFIGLTVGFLQAASPEVRLFNAVINDDLQLMNTIIKNETPNINALFEITITPENEAPCNIKSSVLFLAIFNNNPKSIKLLLQNGAHYELCGDIHLLELAFLKNNQACLDVFFDTIELNIMISLYQQTQNETLKKKLPEKITKAALNILELNEHASQDDIKKAYKKLARKYHTDKQSANTEKIKQINLAQTILITENYLGTETTQSSSLRINTIKNFILVFIKGDASDNALAYDQSGYNKLTEEQNKQLKHFVDDETTVENKWIGLFFTYLKNQNLIQAFVNTDNTDDKENRQTLLQTAIIDENLTSLIEIFLDHGLPIETNVSILMELQNGGTTTTNVSLLAAAVLLKKPDIVEILLAKGADPNYKINKQLFSTDSLITRAFIQDDIESINIFLNHGLSIETNVSLLMELQNGGTTTTNVSLLAAAVLLKKPAIVELLLKNGANPDYKIDANLFGTDSLVTRAFMQGDIESVNYLLLAGAKSSLVNIILCGKFCENASKLPENTSEEQQIKQIVVGQAGLTFIRCATPTKSTMLPLSFVATAGFIAKDLFNFKTEYTKKRKEKAEEKERQEAKELETRLMKQQMHINAVDAASSTQEESKETSDKKEKQTQKVNRSPIKQLQHFMQKYGRDIKKNPRHHALLACTLIPWILHYSCWR